MSVGTDPRYGRLADRVVDAWGIPAGGRVDVKRAILAQWQCEQPGNAWPPVLNNPGFVTLGALHSWGLNLGAVCGRQYASFCLARFPTPEAGADAYAGGVLRGSRYRHALAAARAGHGLAFLAAITSAGWGTRYTCCRSAYASLGGKVPPTTGGSTGPTDTGGTVLSIINASQTGSCTEYTILQPGTTGIGLYPIPRESIGQPCVECAPGFVPAIVSVGPVQLLQGFTGPQDSGGHANACVRAGTKPGDRPSSDPGTIAGDVLGAWVAPLLNGLSELGRNLALLVFILAVLLVGLWLLATADEGSPRIVPV